MSKMPAFMIRRMPYPLRRFMGCLSDEELVEFALDGLSPEARRKAEAHLRDCAHCREQVREMAEMQVGFAYRSPQVAPRQQAVKAVLKKARGPAKARKNMAD
jgi:anti-sigma factor RsiW